MEKIRELDCVALLKDIPFHNLEKGDVGAVVNVLDNHTVDVEFVDKNGKTVAVMSLSEEDIIRLNINLMAV